MQRRGGDRRGARWGLRGWGGSLFDGRGRDFSAALILFFSRNFEVKCGVTEHGCEVMGEFDEGDSLIVDAGAVGGAHVAQDEATGDTFDLGVETGSRLTTENDFVFGRASDFDQSNVQGQVVGLRCLPGGGDGNFWHGIRGLTGETFT